MKAPSRRRARALVGLVPALVLSAGLLAPPRASADHSLLEHANGFCPQTRLTLGFELGKVRFASGPTTCVFSATPMRPVPAVATVYVVGSFVDQGAILCEALLVKARMTINVVVGEDIFPFEVELLLASHVNPHLGLPSVVSLTTQSLVADPLVVATGVFVQAPGCPRPPASVTWEGPLHFVM